MSGWPRRKDRVGIESASRRREHHGHHRPRVIRDPGRHPRPKRRLACCPALTERELERADVVSEQAEEGRQQGERGQDREHHRDRRRVAERRHERDSGDDERQERDRDGPAGEQHRSARRGDRAGDRFV